MTTEPTILAYLTTDEIELLANRDPDFQDALDRTRKKFMVWDNA
jgi:hypothetical protein